MGKMCLTLSYPNQSLLSYANRVRKKLKGWLPEYDDNILEYIALSLRYPTNIYALLVIKSKVKENANARQ